MNRIALTIAAAIAALVPATLGLLGNSTFAQSVPVRVPASAQIMPAEDQPTPTPTATSSHDELDDHGGDRPRDSRVEPGDDRDSLPTASASHSSGRGHDDSGSDDHGGSGHGSDDSGNDDHGGHGSD